MCILIWLVYEIHHHLTLYLCLSPSCVMHFLKLDVEVMSPYSIDIRYLRSFIRTCDFHTVLTSLLLFDTLRDSGPVNIMFSEVMILLWFRWLFETAQKNIRCKMEIERFQLLWYNKTAHSSSTTFIQTSVVKGHKTHYNCTTAQLNNIEADYGSG